MIKILLVGTGGFVGSIFRYAVSGLIHRIFQNQWVPYGTLSVNIIGCFIIGFLGGLIETKQIFNPELRVLVFIGFLGGFTTFSTFSYETLNLARDGQIFTSLSNIILHILLCLSAVWLGNIFSRIL